MQSIWREIAYYGRVLKELIFPRRCVVCGYGIEAGYVCEQCRRNYLLQRVLKGSRVRNISQGRRSLWRWMFWTACCCFINMMAC